MALSSSGPQVEVSLNSVFASRKRGSNEEDKSIQSAMLPGNFQVYAKIDEESRKDNHLVTSFLLTLNDAKSSVTYEFRGLCSITGSSADFEAVMEPNKNTGSRVPKILDIVYQRLYPVVFMLAGMTSSSYPQSIAVLTEMVSSEPIQVQQELSLQKPEEKQEAQAEAPAAKSESNSKPEAALVKEKQPIGSKTAAAK